MKNKDFFDNRFFVLGHRGFSELYPENTMLSFDACASNPKIDGVELDVHLCKSGEVVIAHDFSLKRTAGIDKEIEDLTWDELKDIDVGSFKDPSFSNARLPLLEDLFKKHGKRFFYDVELKVKPGKIGAELCRKTLSIIYKYGLEKQVMVSSFNPFALFMFNVFAGHRLESADIFADEPSIPKLLRQGGGRFISHSSYLKPKYNQVNAGFFIKTGNVPVITWTVNTEQEAKNLLIYKEKGYNLRGLIGNNPEILAKAAKK